jgi:hypothetical protein
VVVTVVLFAGLSACFGMQCPAGSYGVAGDACSTSVNFRLRGFVITILSAYSFDEDIPNSRILVAVMSFVSL